MEWKKSNYLYFTLLAFCVFIYSCEKETIKPIKVESATFSKDVQPIFTSKCIECHNGGRNPNLTSGYAYNSLTKGGYYNVSDPSSSKIYVQLTTSSSHIPKTSDVEKQTILLWIKLGAKND